MGRSVAYSQGEPGTEAAEVEMCMLLCILESFPETGLVTSTMEKAV